eukprot:g62102.t1
MEGSFDYVLLDGSTRSVGAANPVKTLVGWVGLLLTVGAGLGTRQVLFAGKAQAKPAKFVPKLGVEQVMVRPGGLPPVALPPVQEKQPRCIFSYGSWRSHDEGKKSFAAGGKQEDGWVYGAHLPTSKTQLAVATGKPDDIIRGRLICWPAGMFAYKLQELDIQRQYNEGEEGVVRRGEVAVVTQAGEAQHAIWYFQVMEEAPPAEASQQAEEAGPSMQRYESLVTLRPMTDAPKAEDDGKGKGKGDGRRSGGFGASSSGGFGSGNKNKKGSGGGAKKKLRVGDHVIDPDRLPLGRNPDIDAVAARARLHLPLAGRLTEADVTLAWKKAAAEHHPDRGGVEDNMQEVNVARDLLLRRGASLLEVEEEEKIRKKEEEKREKKKRNKG